jgi:hypothetical protein
MGQRFLRTCAQKTRELASRVTTTVEAELVSVYLFFRPTTLSLLYQLTTLIKEYHPLRAPFTKVFT